MSANETMEFWPVISAYSRAQAIEDGMLIAVDEPTASEAGFKFPIAMTAAVFEQCVAVPEGLESQDVAGRLWDVLWMLRCAIKRSIAGSDIPFELFVRSKNSGPRLCGRDLVKLKALCGPGDDAEPVITIMLPHED